MKAVTRGRPKTKSGAKSTAKDTQKQAFSAIQDAQSQATAAIRDARKQATATLRESRKQARRQALRARITAARLRAGTKAKARGGTTTAAGVAGVAGLAAGYFLDPDSGRRRRHIARDRALALIRKGADRTRREAEYRTGQVEGKIELAKSKSSPERPAANDQALAEKVKSEIFQPADTPKSSVNVNVEHGVVYLRGEVKRPDQIRKLIEQAGSVEGVAGVENLLHTP